MSDLKVDSISSKSGSVVTVDDELIVLQDFQANGPVTLLDLGSGSGFIRSTAGLLSLGAAIEVSDIPSQIPATRIADGSVTDTEFKYLDGVTDNIQDQLTALEGNPIETQTPIGAIVMCAVWPPPTGWMECDGSALVKEDYPLLHGIVTDKYGTPSDTAKFFIPDLRGMFVRGWQNDRTAEAPSDSDVANRYGVSETIGGASPGSGAAVIGTLQATAGGGHIHSGIVTGIALQMSEQEGGVGSGPFKPNFSELASYNIYGSGGPNSGPIVEAAGNEYRPYNICLMYIIKHA